MPSLFRLNAANATLTGLFACSLFLAGCNKHATTNASAMNDSGATVANAPGGINTDNMSALDLYEAKMYKEAQSKAETEMISAKGRERDVDELIAGLSALALNRQTVAEHYLQGLTGSSDPQIAGRAEAGLGQIAQSRGNNQYAANLFKRASEKLEGDDAARANVRAGNALSKINKPGESITQYKAAMSAAQSAQIKAHAQTLTQNAQGPFTLQAGVFSTPTNANKKAQEIAARLNKAGLSSFVTPRVVPDTLNGKQAYSVQMGTFKTKQDALNAKARIANAAQCIVVAQ